MKKTIMLLLVLSSLFLVIGCSKSEVEKPESEILVGYMVIEDNTLHFDEVEIVKMEDKERMNELDLKDSDMVSTYLIINENQDEITFDLADEVEYTFTDFEKEPDSEKEADFNRLYTTIKKDEFLSHLGNLNDIPLSEQTIPYFIEVQNGKVISIEEKLEYTI